MVWLLFVFFYLHQDGLPWWGWCLFIGFAVYDWHKDRKTLHVIVDSCSKCDKSKKHEH